MAVQRDNVISIIPDLTQILKCGSAGNRTRDLMADRQADNSAKEAVQYQ